MCVVKASTAVTSRYQAKSKGSFICSCPVFPALLIEETIFSPLYILALFVKGKVPLGTWVYLWAFYLVPLVYISI